MLFNSNEFLVFLGIFLGLYWLARASLAARNGLVVVASYVFYGWWDYRFAGLLLLTSVADYTFGRLLHASARPGRRRLLLVASILLNLSVLGGFKYFNFFSESLHALLDSLGWSVHWGTLRVVLPVGISFYTFQSMSYVMDVYRGHLPAERNLVSFLAFVAFFPQLVAGPIERATHLLPQFARTLHITPAHLRDGLALMLWGGFQKVVLADNLAPLAELAFDHAAPSLPVVLLGAVAFGLQVYADFAGYSNIARGTAKLLGFDLMVNFNAPYIATSLRDFWQRWHISLSTWIRDYLYIPLGGNRHGSSRTYLNLLIAMTLAGLWHGASLNFVLWGAWHGTGLAVNRFWQQHRPDRLALPAALSWFLTLSFVGAGWVLFRSPDFGRTLNLLAGLTSLATPAWWGTACLSLILLAIPLCLAEAAETSWARSWHERFREAGWAHPALQALLLLAVMAWWQRDAAAFIYFQF